MYIEGGEVNQETGLCGALFVRGAAGGGGGGAGGGADRGVVWGRTGIGGMQHHSRDMDWLLRRHVLSRQLAGTQACAASSVISATRACARGS